MSALEDVYNQKSFQYLFEVETLAQDILTDKEAKLDLSNARNKFREAFRALESAEDRRTWMQMGSVYIERSTEECKEILKTEIANADKDIRELDDNIKTKVHKLRDLEHEPRLLGFTLNPISASEAKTLHKAFGAAAGFVIYKKARDDILYLLLQTSYGEHHWTPPKGHVDPGETEMVTAIRETVEESGLTKDDLKIYEDCKKVLQYKVKGKPKVVTYWLAELSNPSAVVKLSKEHQDYKWLKLEDACVYGKYADLQELLKHFDSYIRSNL